MRDRGGGGAVQATQLVGKTVVVTGASDGIGAAAAHKLALRGARVVIVGRSALKTARVASAIGAQGFVADYARLDEVRRVAAEIRASVDRIDVLVNNAGGAFNPRRATPDGYEPNFQVNHLAPFLLTTLLREVLAATPGTSRVINTASAVHLAAPVRADVPQQLPTGRNLPMRHYAWSKMMNIRFAVALNEKWSRDHIVAGAVHPGIVATSFGRDSVVIRTAFRTPIRRLVSIDPATGAGPLVALAADLPAEELAGRYFHRYRPGFAMRSDALDRRLADELWHASEGLVGNV
ncbi:MAG: SDR family NAD(P)-dependent oxidoreductase [Aeromicrobium sp.]